MRDAAPVSQVGGHAAGKRVGRQDLGAARREEHRCPHVHLLPRPRNPRHRYEGLGRLRRQWFAKRKNVIALLRETIFQQESPLVDTDANNKLFPIKVTNAQSALFDQLAIAHCAN